MRDVMAKRHSVLVYAVSSLTDGPSPPDIRDRRWIGQKPSRDDPDHPAPFPPMQLLYKGGVPCRHL